MQFNSFQFLIFFPVVLAVYFIIPRKLRYIWLLAVSYFFYSCWNRKYTLLLLFSTVITYTGALLVDRFKSSDSKNKAKLALSATLIINLGVLGYFKYADFFISRLNSVIKLFSPDGGFSALNVLLPVGISFYIFQAVGYTCDVYYGKLKPERNLLRYALFVSFFPQLVAGPIERSTNLMPQLNNVDKLELRDIKRIRRGALIMLYGFIMKVVIADRAAISVNQVFADHLQYSAVQYAVNLALFAVQIYCDFAGYTYIAIGASKIMGIELMNNFNSPYLAVSVTDFWKRWHISLSSWFRDYLYIPLGGSRCRKIKKYRNLFIIFAVSGMWHGAAGHFIAWGVVHAILRILDEMLEPLRCSLRTGLRISKDSKWLRPVRTVITFMIISYAWLFFRGVSMSQIFDISRALFTSPWDLSLCANLENIIFLPKEEGIFLLIMLVLLFVSDCMREKHLDFAGWFEERSLVFRAFIFILGITFILMFGVYGPNYSASAFIYFQF